MLASDPFGPLCRLLAPLYILFLFQFPRLQYLKSEHICLVPMYFCGPRLFWTSTIQSCALLRSLAKYAALPRATTDGFAAPNHESFRVADTLVSVQDQ
jgi:hypothetical protein